MAGPELDSLHEAVTALGPEEALGNFKISELKNMCKRFGLKSSGSKIDLITKVAEHILSANKVEHEQGVDEKHVLGNHNRVPWSELTPASAPKNFQCTDKSPLCEARSAKGKTSKENVIMHLLTKESKKPPHEDRYQDDEKATNATKTIADMVEKEDCEAGKHEIDSTFDSAGEEHMSDENDFKEHVGVTPVLDASGTSFAVGGESVGCDTCLDAYAHLLERAGEEEQQVLAADVVTREKGGASARKRGFGQPKSGKDDKCKRGKLNHGASDIQGRLRAQKDSSVFSSSREADMSDDIDVKDYVSGEVAPDASATTQRMSEQAEALPTSIEQEQVSACNSDGAIWPNMNSNMFSTAPVHCEVTGYDVD